jgi:hypothetical protein
VIKPSNAMIHHATLIGVRIFATRSQITMHITSWIALDWWRGMLGFFSLTGR